jgi:hypothetical protein
VSSLLTQTFSVPTGTGFATATGGGATATAGGAASASGTAQVKSSGSSKVIVGLGFTGVVTLLGAAFAAM